MEEPINRSWVPLATSLDFFLEFHCIVRTKQGKSQKNFVVLYYKNTSMVGGKCRSCLGFNNRNMFRMMMYSYILYLYELLKIPNSIKKYIDYNFVSIALHRRGASLLLIGSL